MGAYGTGLYQDDVAADARDSYINELKKGRDNEEITEELIGKYAGEINDSDDSTVFWLALADTQWKYGRLLEKVKIKALRCIETGEDIERWRESSQSNLRKRKEMLSKLKEQLMSEQPEPKKIRIERPYICSWKIGDVYALPIKNENNRKILSNNKYILFHKVGESNWYPYHVIPIVRVKLTDDIDMNKNKFDTIEYIRVGTFPYLPDTACFPIDRTGCNSREEYLRRIEIDKSKYTFNKNGSLDIYQLELIIESKRSIPKDLIYIGNFDNVKLPNAEYVPRNPVCLPSEYIKKIEEIITKLYSYYNND